VPKRSSHKVGSELFIVDNSAEDWKAVRYLRDWCQLSKALDVATGYFEIGSLLALDGEWQKLDKIRILMGDEVSRRTKKAFENAFGGLKQKLDGSIDTEKRKNHFLIGAKASRFQGSEPYTISFGMVGHWARTCGSQEY
jgi:hypothetical protein